MKALLLTGLLAGGLTLTAQASIVLPDASAASPVLDATQLISESIYGITPSAQLVDETYTPELVIAGKSGACEVGTVHYGIAPVPEPSTWLAGAILMMVLGTQSIRHFRNRKHAACLK